MSTLPIWKSFVQKLPDIKVPMTWYSVMRENNRWSDEKNGPIILPCVILHHTFTLGMSHSSSRVSKGFSKPYIFELCLFSILQTWNVDSSLKQTRLKTLDVNLACPADLLQTLRHGLFSGLRACSNCTS